MRKGWVFSAVAALTLGSAGCEAFLTDFAAGSTVRVLRHASPAVQRFADVDLVETALPGSISTMEGLLLIKQDSEELRELVAKSYASFGFGFLEDRMEQANVADDVDTVEHYRGRASAAYLRSREIAMDQMKLWVPDAGSVLAESHKGAASWSAYLAKFNRPEQAGVLFWCAYSWARYIGLNKTDMAVVADLGAVKALVDKVLTLDASYSGYSPRALRAGLNGSTSAQMGGDPTAAKAEFDEIIQLTGGHNLMYLVVEARVVAVQLQDRSLYTTLLQKVLDAEDTVPDLRLPNQLAKRKAMRYLADVDNLFEAEPSPVYPSSGGAGH